jgi:1-acyl-sn-glycerol-3-phosphate acyltransferase
MNSNLQPAVSVLRWTALWAVWLFLMLVLPGAYHLVGANSRSASRYSNWMGIAGLRILNVRWTSNIDDVELPENGCIYLANHRSWLDSLLLNAVLRKPLKFLAKAGYFDTPVLGLSLRLFGYYAVKLDGDRKTLPVWKLGQDFREGYSIVFYPEGTRTTTEVFRQFERGAFVLAARSGVPLVPVHIYGTLDILNKKNSLLSLRPGRTHVHFEDAVRITREHCTAQAVRSFQEEFERSHERFKPVL